ncbi:MAG: L-seryl-tRNA(Sec) selenium transferase, partial [Candidatus Limnocylindrales bacterium]
ALGATLGLYRAGLAETHVPVWQMIAADPVALRTRAQAILAGLPEPLRARTSVEALASTVGGGSLPGETLPSFGLAVRSGSASRQLAELRQGSPCVVARIAGGAMLLDLRTVLATDDRRLGQALGQLRAG